MEIKLQAFLMQKVKLSRLIIENKKSNIGHIDQVLQEYDNLKTELRSI